MGMSIKEVRGGRTGTSKRGEDTSFSFFVGESCCGGCSSGAIFNLLKQTYQPDGVMEFAKLSLATCLSY